jgi:hypothetical protein
MTHAGPIGVLPGASHSVQQGLSLELAEVKRPVRGSLSLHSQRQKLSWGEKETKSSRGVSVTS